MSSIKPQTLKGFRDFLPQEARKRQYVINTLKEVFESYGFEPLETPALEYEEILLGKYGEEGDKLLYRFTDHGGRKVAMRYDQTVPLARVVAQYQNKLPMPFKRYQMQPVWRAENPQKGRFREFLQCDADIVGTKSLLADTQVIVTAIKSLEKIGFKNFKVIINDRNNFSYFQQQMNLSQEQVMDIIRSIDKLKKIGRAGVIEELGKKLESLAKAEEIIDSFASIKPTEDLLQLFNYLKEFGIEEEKMQFLPSLARGLDYYTSTIFEIEIEGYTAGSVCGGGRYDNLIGMFSKTMNRNGSWPAVGFAFGFDRILDAMEQFNLFPQDILSSATKVLVTIFSKDLKEKSLELSSRLRSNNINTELYLDEDASLEKQLKYADQKNIPFVIILGPEEVEKNVVKLRDMKTREQETATEDQLITKLRNF